MSSSPPAPATADLDGDVDTADLGKIRRLTRLASADGFLLVAALDHPENYLELFDRDVTAVRHETVVRSKLQLAHALAGHCSALLLDPVFSLGQAVLTADLPGSLGMLSSIELLGYRDGGFELDTRLRPQWNVAKIAASGADGVKLFFYYRPEQRAVADEQRALVAGLVGDCSRLQVPLVLEPIWYPLPGEDPTDPALRQARVEGIVASAHEFAAAGADVLKVEFPGSVADERSRAEALEACRRLDEGLRRPWVLLSAGVSFDDFAVQVGIAARAGASGYIAGRAIWRDAVGNLPDDVRIAGLATAGRRLDQLNGLVREHGRPWRVPPTADRVAEAVPAAWHETYLA
jgi:tagatose-1,6-bisphosphate aldolase